MDKILNVTHIITCTDTSEVVAVVLPATLAEMPKTHEYF